MIEVGGNQGKVHNQRQGTGDATVLGPSQATEFQAKLASQAFQAKLNSELQAEKMKAEDDAKFKEKLHELKFNSDGKYAAQIGEAADKLVWDQSQKLYEKAEEEGRILTFAEKNQIMKSANTVNQLIDYADGLQTALTANADTYQKNPTEFTKVSMLKNIDFAEPENLMENFKKGRSIPLLEYQKPVMKLHTEAQSIFKDFKGGDKEEAKKQVALVMDSSPDFLETVKRAHSQYVRKGGDPYDNMVDYFVDSTKGVWSGSEQQDYLKVLDTASAMAKNMVTYTDGKGMPNVQGLKELASSLFVMYPGLEKLGKNYDEAYSKVYSILHSQAIPGNRASGEATQSERNQFRKELSMGTYTDYMFSKNPKLIEQAASWDLKGSADFLGYVDYRVEKFHVSPDGESITYTVAKPISKDNYKYSELYNARNEAQWDLEDIISKNIKLKSQNKAAKDLDKIDRLEKEIEAYSKQLKGFQEYTDVKDITIPLNIAQSRELLENNYNVRIVKEKYDYFNPQKNLPDPSTSGIPPLEPGGADKAMD